MVTGELTGPGLDRGDAGLSVPVLERIRSGVAHPTIGAGIALSLLTQLPILFLHSLPWEALSPGNDALRLTWFPCYATLVPSTFTLRRQHPITAVFPVPPAIRPLLQAVRFFAAESDNTTGRLFASTSFTFEHIGAAAAHCKITLPDQHPDRAANLLQTWQSRITCTYTPYLGSKYDTGFIADQGLRSPLAHARRPGVGRQVLEAERGRGSRPPTMRPQDPHHPQPAEQCTDISMTESLTTKCDLSGSHRRD